MRNSWAIHGNYMFNNNELKRISRIIKTNTTMNETDYCNMISDAINEHFRGENNGYDSDVFVDERIEPGVIALNWHTYLDSYVTTEYVTRVAQFVFSKFGEVTQILSPCKDFKR